jgi:hypothetical protein
MKGSGYPVAGGGSGRLTTSFATCQPCHLSSLPPLVRPSHFISITNGGDDLRLYAERKRRDPYLPPDPTDPPDNPLFELLASVSSVVSTQIPLPIGGGGSISLGFPLFLASTIFILPTTTSFLLGVFFIFYLYFGRSVAGGIGSDANDDDVEDENVTSDLLALFGAVASAGLLSPDGLAISAESDGSMSGAGVGLLALGSISILASALGQSEAQKFAAARNDNELDEANRKLMDLWDYEFDKKSRGPK